MSYMEQQMQQHIEAGLSEADRCYSRIAELEAECGRLEANLASKTEIANQLKDGLAESFEERMKLKAERDDFAAKLATLEADVLDREADFIISAPADSGVKWSKAVIDTHQRIGSVMKSRAALARARVGAE